MKKNKPTVDTIRLNYYTQYFILYRHRRQNIPANTGYSPNAVSMLGHRLRRWPNIEIALGECPVFAGIPILHRLDLSLFSLVNVDAIF